MIITLKLARLITDLQTHIIQHIKSRRNMISKDLHKQRQQLNDERQNQLTEILNNKEGLHICAEAEIARRLILHNAPQATPQYTSKSSGGQLIGVVVWLSTFL